MNETKSDEHVDDIVQVVEDIERMMNNDVQTILFTRELALQITGAEADDMAEREAIVQSRLWLRFRRFIGRLSCGLLPS